MMRSNHPRLSRLACLFLSLCFLIGAFASCAGQGDEVPDGYQYATCRGEYFRLFIPTQWRINTESGISGGYYYSGTNMVSVSMTEVPFTLEDETGAEPRVATLDDFFAAHLEDVGTLAGFTQEKNFDATLGGKRAKDITYTARVAGANYRYRQVLCKVEGRFYLFTYSSVAEEFEKWLDTVDGILENIIFYAVPYDGSEDNRLPEVDDVPDGMKLVSNNDVPFRFFAPDDWVTVPGSAAFQVCASETDRSNVSVIGYVPSGADESYDHAAYWAEVEKEYQLVLKDYKLVSVTEEETMGGRKAAVYEYTYTLGGVTYCSRQVVCGYSLMVISMTYTALPENYDTHMEDVKAMQAALTFRKNIFG